MKIKKIRCKLFGVILSGGLVALMFQPYVLATTITETEQKNPKLSLPQNTVVVTQSESQECKFSMGSPQLTLPSSLKLSDNLLIFISVSDGNSPLTVESEQTSILGMATEKYGFFRPVKNLVFHKLGDATYQASLNMAKFVIETNLWPAIRKAQGEWGTTDVQLTFRTRLVDSNGCISEELVANTNISIEGFTRNNSILGLPPIITRLEAPSTISFGKEFAVRGQATDSDEDLGEQVKISGYFQVSWLPLKFRLPPNLRAKKIGNNQFQTVFSSREFGFYEKLIKLIPTDSVDITTSISIEDEAGHLSEPKKINFTVYKSKENNGGDV